MAIPPLVIPPRASADGGQASQSTSNVASPREIISGDAWLELSGGKGTVDGSEIPNNYRLDGV